MIKDNIFNEGMLSAIQNTARSHSYYPLDRGDDTSIYVSSCPAFFERKLNAALEEEFGKFETITSYFRSNTPDIDTHLRVHSDRDILGQQPTHGVVFFMDITEGGTGFYDHVTHGDRLPKGAAQDESEYGDESLWTFREFTEGKPNRMIAYPSNMFHMRHPIIPSSDRLVWVSFIKVGE